LEKKTKNKKKKKKKLNKNEDLLASLIGVTEVLPSTEKEKQKNLLGDKKKKKQLKNSKKLVVCFDILLYDFFFFIFHFFLYIFLFIFIVKTFRKGKILEPEKKKEKSEFSKDLKKNVEKIEPELTENKMRRLKKLEVVLEEELEEKKNNTNKGLKKNGGKSEERYLRGKRKIKKLNGLENIIVSFGRGEESDVVPEINKKRKNKNFESSKGKSVVRKKKNGEKNGENEKDEEKRDEKKRDKGKKPKGDDKFVFEVCFVTEVYI
jgi:hypothetical protein